VVPLELQRRAVPEERRFEARVTPQGRRESSRGEPRAGMTAETGSSEPARLGLCARPAGPSWTGEDVWLPGDRAGSEQAAARAARRDAPGPGVAGQRAGCDLPMGRNMTARAACRGRGHPAARHAPVESGLHRCPARRRTVFIGRVRGADRGRRAVERVRGSWSASVRAGRCRGTAGARGERDRLGPSERGAAPRGESTGSAPRCHCSRAGEQRAAEPTIVVADRSRWWIAS
jgi:hypothetical protein